MYNERAQSNPTYQYVRVVCRAALAPHRATFYQKTYQMKDAAAVTAMNEAPANSNGILCDADTCEG